MAESKANGQRWRDTVGGRHRIPHARINAPRVPITHRTIALLAADGEGRRVIPTAGLKPGSPL